MGALNVFDGVMSIEDGRNLCHTLSRGRSGGAMSSPRQGALEHKRNVPVEGSVCGLNSRDSGLGGFLLFPWYGATKPDRGSSLRSIGGLSLSRSSIDRMTITSISKED